jgi:hypothetical protein
MVLMADVVVSAAHPLRVPLIGPGDDLSSISSPYQFRFRDDARIPTDAADGAAVRFPLTSRATLLVGAWRSRRPEVH